MSTTKKNNNNKVSFVSVKCFLTQSVFFDLLLTLVVPLSGMGLLPSRLPPLCWASVTCGQAVLALRFVVPFVIFVCFLFLLFIVPPRCRRRFFCLR